MICAGLRISVSCKPRHLKVSGQHADNTHRVAVNLDGLIHRSRVAVKPAQPQPVGDHGCRGTVRKVLFRREVSPAIGITPSVGRKFLRNVNAVQRAQDSIRQIAIAIAVSRTSPTETVFVDRLPIGEPRNRSRRSLKQHFTLGGFFFDGAIDKKPFQSVTYKRLAIAI